MIINLSNHEKHCSKLLKIIGDYWTLEIIMALRSGERRFCELERTLVNTNPVTLTSRLKKLHINGFIDRRKETIDKLSVVYSLNEKGRKLLPVINEIQKFADKYK
jgi:DNA-binding HxlR family transcriptional regulator